MAALKLSTLEDHMSLQDQEVTARRGRINFDQFHQPFDPGDGGMSPMEEDYLDKMLLDSGQAHADLWEGEHDFIAHNNDRDDVSEGSSDGEEEMGLSWQDDKVTDKGAKALGSLPFEPSTPPGIQMRMLTRFVRQTAKTPIHFFSFFLSFDLVASICNATNAYAEMVIKKGQFQCYATQVQQKDVWSKVTTMEMYKFIGILMYMSLNKLPNLECYWSEMDDPVFGPTSELVRENMSKHRFMSLLAFLHVAPPGNIKKEEKISYVRPLLKHMKTVSHTLYFPYRELSIKDRMLETKKRLGNLENEPHRYGCKLFGLVCAVTGYTYELLLYVEKADYKWANHPEGIPYSIVHTLTADFQNQGYQLFLEGYFMSKTLLRDLFSSSIFTTSTLKAGSPVVPSSLRDWQEWDEAAKKGDFRWQREMDSYYVVVQHKDTSTKSYLSTLHMGSAVDSKTHIPKLVVDFKQGSDGFNRSINNMHNYPFKIGDETLHWWKCVFMHCIDMMVMNSYIIYTEYVDRFPAEFATPCNELDFRKALVKSLLVQKRRGMDLSPCRDCMPEMVVTRRDCAVCNAQARLEGNSCPSTKTSFICKHCCVPLCIYKDRNCFAKWHMPDGKNIREWVRAYGRKRKHSD
ncbi:piggyBac transposable element-derived protein 4-like isoform X2 [Pecten maximus]|uniref:piggyBac transposable element-derived protein 4-like isoform X2 n=1 Tax=Pecten maximus TaxID=6579 RepID=UPI0014585DCE|nr:piggyBac transposable element-derived protein 4-like isoform X2 [Pecten maximus]